MNPILKSYFPIADMIAGTFGETCEVAVHDLEHPESSVVYVANGTVTGRKIGQSFDYLIKKVLLNKNYKDDHVINYTFDTPDGKKIKSSSAMIRDEHGEVIGMLCINCDLTFFQQMQHHVNQFLCSEDDPSDIKDQDLDSDVLVVIDNLIRKTLADQDVNNMSRKQAVEIIRFMNEKGIFLVKGSIEKVAAIMGVSKVTIYSYLDEAKGKR